MFTAVQLCKSIFAELFEKEGDSSTEENIVNYGVVISTNYLITYDVINCNNSSNIQTEILQSYTVAMVSNFCIITEEEMVQRTDTLFQFPWKRMTSYNRRVKHLI